MVAYLVNDSGAAAVGEGLTTSLAGMLYVSFRLRDEDDDIVNFPIPPRPDAGAGVPRAGATTAVGRPRSTWGYWEGMGVYLMRSFPAGFATDPILALLGSTIESTARSADRDLRHDGRRRRDGRAARVLAARWHPEWREAMVLPPAQDRIWRDLLFGAIAGLILVPAVGLISGVVAALFREAVGHDVTVPDQVAPGLSRSRKSFLWCWPS